MRPMTDDQPLPPPDDAGDEAPIGGVSEAELDDMLAQAGELVGELTTQLGEPEPLPLADTGDSGSAAEVAPPLPEPQSGGSTLEDELAQLEALTQATSTEVLGAAELAAPEVPDDTGTAEDETTERALPRDLPERSPPPPRYDPDVQAEYEELFPGGFPPPVPPEIVEQAITGPAAAQWPIEEEQQAPSPDAPDDAAPQTNDAVPEESETPKARPVEESDTIPDFMKEFMEPEPEETPPSQAPATPDTPDTPELVTQATSVPVQTKPGVVGTGTLHQVVKPAQAEGEPVPGTTPEQTVPKSANALVQKLRDIAVALLQRVKSVGPVTPLLVRAGYWLCDKAVFVLEKADKPISKVGGRVRKLAGWLAAATLGTSIIVYIISLF